MVLASCVKSLVLNQTQLWSTASCEELRVLSSLQGSTLLRMELPHTIFLLWTGFSSRQDQKKRARQITRWSVWHFFLVGALCLLAGHHLRITRGPVSVWQPCCGCEMTLQKFTRNNEQQGFEPLQRLWLFSVDLCPVLCCSLWFAFWRNAVCGSSCVVTCVFLFLFSSHMDCCNVHGHSITVCT